MLYTRYLVEWNSRINIIGITDTDRIINELILDSMIPVPFIPEKGRLIDLGSGAGLPGIVIKILRPLLEVNLIDSNRKKTSFLKHITRELNLSDTNVFNMRVNDFREQSIKPFDIVTSRAMVSLDNIIESGFGLLAEDGKIIGFLGNNDKEELEKSGPAMKAHSLNIHESRTYELPGKKGKRTIVVLKRS
jgi:16S rRNA (guanine527-N7)-methyltransferase